MSHTGRPGLPGVRSAVPGAPGVPGSPHLAGPEPARSRSRRLRAPAGVLALAAGAVGYVAAVDPNRPGHYPTCPFLALTGWYCPGCGGLRMVHALATGHPVAAFGRNPVAFLLIPLVGWLWIRWTVCTARGTPMTSALFRTRAVWALAVLLVVFGVARNLPIGRALAP